MPRVRSHVCHQLLTLLVLSPAYSQRHCVLEASYHMDIWILRSDAVLIIDSHVCSSSNNNSKWRLKCSSSRFTTTCMHSMVCQTNLLPQVCFMHACPCLCSQADRHTRPRLTAARPRTHAHTNTHVIIHGSGCM
jgi:hypothetical protein